MKSFVTGMILITKNTQFYDPVCFCESELSELAYGNLMIIVRVNKSRHIIECLDRDGTLQIFPLSLPLPLPLTASYLRDFIDETS